MKPVSIDTAIQRGLAMVYGPFFLFVVGIPIAMLILFTHFNISTIFVLPSVPAGILVAWAWWSFRVPQWRIWALQHVEDIENLHKRAVQIGIEWPYGHIFERTEIKSQQLALREVLLQLRYYLQCAIKEVCAINDVSVNNDTANIIYVMRQLNLDEPVTRAVMKALMQDIQRLLQYQTIQKAGATYQVLVTTEYFLAKYQRLKENHNHSL